MAARCMRAPVLVSEASSASHEANSTEPLLVDCWPPLVGGPPDSAAAPPPPPRHSAGAMAITFAENAAREFPDLAPTYNSLASLFTKQ